MIHNLHACFWGGCNLSEPRIRGKGISVKEGAKANTRWNGTRIFTDAQENWLIGHAGYLQKECVEPVFLNHPVVLGKDPFCLLSHWLKFTYGALTHHLTSLDSHLRRQSHCWSRWLDLGFGTTVAPSGVNLMVAMPKPSPCSPEEEEMMYDVKRQLCQGACAETEHIPPITRYHST